VKYNSAGSVEWLARVSGAGTEQANAICSMSDGGICVTGYYSSTTTTLTAFHASGTAFGTTLGQSTPTASQEVFIVKYNSAGTVQWLARVSGAGNDIANGICSMSDGGIGKSSGFVVVKTSNRYPEIALLEEVNGVLEWYFPANDDSARVDEVTHWIEIPKF
jgi:hypothetical protein